MGNDGNGKVEPNIAQPETPGKIKVVPLLIISIGEDKHVYISGEVEKKELCFEAIAETIKFIAHYQPKVIITQSIGHRIMDFARKITGRR
jgi:hypothetical protein